MARPFAERGYQVVVQSWGAFGSGGEWQPFRHERADGRRALEWMAEQPWWSGSVVTFDPSDLGLTQWALLGERLESATTLVVPTTRILHDPDRPSAVELPPSDL